MKILGYFFKAVFILWMLITLVEILTPKPKKEVYDKPCENSIDFDWDRGVYICPEDTHIWMRDPRGRGWIKKEDYVPPKRARVRRLPKTRAEEALETLDEYGLD